MEINGYDIEIVCANNEDGVYGDIYDDAEECKKDHPNEEIMYGYCCYPKDSEKPALDWFWTLEDAIEFTHNPKIFPSLFAFQHHTFL